VLTLNEAAAYLRLPAPDVVRLIKEQGLPARQLGEEWRILKSAVNAWLGTPVHTLRPGIWAAAGALKDDPYLEDMLQEIDRMRHRPAREKGQRQNKHARERATNLPWSRRGLRHRAAPGSGGTA
jgi:excisionase family DNA binding protein